MKRSRSYKILVSGFFIPSLVILLTGFAPKVGQKIELDARRNARASANFRVAAGNVAFLAEKGLTGDVSDVKYYNKTGNYGVEVTVTSGTDTHGRSRVGEKVWVYYNTAKTSNEVDPGSKYMKIMDANGVVLNGEQIPERADTIETTTRLPATTGPISAEEPVAPVLGTASAPVTDARLESAPPCDGNCGQPNAGLTDIAATAEAALRATLAVSGTSETDPTTWLSPIRGARCEMSNRGYGRQMHPIYHRRRMHDGQDIQAPHGTSLVAPADGEIVGIKRARKGSRRGYGNQIRMKIGNIEVSYSHMAGFSAGLKKGMRITAGQVIGTVGSTGLSTGPHLHLETEVRGRRVNPMTVFKSRQICK